MRICVNSETRDVPDGATVQRLVDELQLSGNAIAVELNRTLVSRARYRETPLREGDRLEIVTFVGGG